ncbi:MAG TPA: response regulator [Waterburya sp.]|jgi:twitching motility two-component system response regulator PilG
MSLQSQQPTILAVDDSPVMQEMIKQALAQDYNVLVADSAEAALSLLYHQPITMLLLDVCMPEIDGLELCRTLRSLPEFRDLPIMLVTGKDRVFDKVQGRLAGANEYLTKPFNAEQLRQSCRQLLSIHDSTVTKKKD